MRRAFTDKELDCFIDYLFDGDRFFHLQFEYGGINKRQPWTKELLEQIQKECPDTTLESSHLWHKVSNEKAKYVRLVKGKYEGDLDKVDLDAESELFGKIHREVLTALHSKTKRNNPRFKEFISKFTETANKHSDLQEVIQETDIVSGAQAMKAKLERERQTTLSRWKLGSKALSSRRDRLLGKKNLVERQQSLLNCQLDQQKLVLKFISEQKGTGNMSNSAELLLLKIADIPSTW